MCSLDRIMSSVCAQLYTLITVVLLMTSPIGSQYPRPCTDILPLYLLKLVVPDRYQLPAGVEIVYDRHNSIHGYRFTPDMTSLHCPAAKLFKFCDFFPEEFSVLVTLKLSEVTLEKDECVFALITRGSDKVSVGIQIYKGWIHFHYEDRKTKQRKVTEFTETGVLDTEWHTLILTVTGDTVALRLDCGPPERKRLRRLFPAFINTRNSNLHVANCNRRENGLFTGLLKELLLLPGSDVSRDACPVSSGYPDYNKPSTPNGVYPPYVLDSVCTWRDSGKLHFDVYRKVLQVCYSGVWQTILLPPEDEDTKEEEEENKHLTEKMDYIIWHQDIITAAPTIDIEIFRIPDEGLFLAAASFDSSNMKKQQSTILKWTDGNFRVYQSLYTLGAQGWEYFTVGSKYFLAVANTGSKRDKPSKSVIYKWSRRRKRFHAYQELITWTARDIEYFRIDNNHYLAVANHVRGHNHSIESNIFRWSDSDKLFQPVQDLLTVGAYDWTHFAVAGYHFLAVANSYSGPPMGTTRLQSEVFFWRDGAFLPFQTLETVGATDWEFFTIDDGFYLVVANAYNYGPHTTNSTERYRTNSTVYRLNTVRKRFEVYQNIITYSAVDWEYFSVGRDHYLIVSNAQHDGVTDYSHRHLATTRSVIYRWQGVEKFVPVHYLESLASADWEVFRHKGETYLVYANANDIISQVYKIKLV